MHRALQRRAGRRRGQAATFALAQRQHERASAGDEPGGVAQQRLAVKHGQVVQILVVVVLVHLARQERAKGRLDHRRHDQRPQRDTGTAALLRAHELVEHRVGVAAELREQLGQRGACFVGRKILGVLRAVDTPQHAVGLLDGIRFHLFGRGQHVGLALSERLRVGRVPRHRIGNALHEPLREERRVTKLVARDLEPRHEARVAHARDVLGHHLGLGVHALAEVVRPRRRVLIRLRRPLEPQAQRAPHVPALDLTARVADAGDLDKRVEEVEPQRREACAPAQQRRQRVHQRDVARPARCLRCGVLQPWRDDGVGRVPVVGRKHVGELALAGQPQHVPNGRLQVDEPQFAVDADKLPRHVEHERLCVVWVALDGEALARAHAPLEVLLHAGDALDGLGRPRLAHLVAVGRRRHVAARVCPERRFDGAKLDGFKLAAVERLVGLLRLGQHLGVSAPDEVHVVPVLLRDAPLLVHAPDERVPVLRVHELATRLRVVVDRAPLAHLVAQQLEAVGVAARVHHGADDFLDAAERVPLAKLGRVDVRVPRLAARLGQRHEPRVHLGDDAGLGVPVALQRAHDRLDEVGHERAILAAVHESRPVLHPLERGDRVPAAQNPPGRPRWRLAARRLGGLGPLRQGAHLRAQLGRCLLQRDLAPVGLHLVHSAGKVPQRGPHLGHVSETLQRNILPRGDAIGQEAL